MKADAGDLRRTAETRLGIPAPLHGYQWEGVSFLFRSHGALLADEMGLGKTVQASVALALLLDAQTDVRRALIVAPASLTLNWMAELDTWAPEVTVRRLQGDLRDRVASYMLPIPVLVGSYEQIRADGLDRVPRDAFDLVVLDEAQRIKDRNSTTSLACRLLPRRRSWALSGTPLENKLDDISTILAFLDPATPVRPTRREVTKSLAQMMLRRLKSEVRGELPPVIQQDMSLELAPEQRRRYDAVWSERASRVAVDDSDRPTAMLGLITELKGICNRDEPSGTSSKLDALRTVIDSAGPSARIIVFSQFVQSLKWISERLSFRHDLLVGSMDMASRESAMRSFRTGPGPRALLVSLRAAGVGLNLGETSHVVLFDRWWNPAVENQAIYRAHRFDRHEPLHVVRFIVRNTIEERIALILQEKKRLFEKVVEGAGASPKGFERDELARILGLPSAPP